jgi:hypothetical protein
MALWKSTIVSWWGIVDELVCVLFATDSDSTNIAIAVHSPKSATSTEWYYGKVQ